MAGNKNQSRNAKGQFEPSSDYLADLDNFRHTLPQAIEINKLRKKLRDPEFRKSARGEMAARLLKYGEAIDSMIESAMKAGRDDDIRNLIRLADGNAGELRRLLAAIDNEKQPEGDIQKQMAQAMRGIE